MDSFIEVILPLSLARTFTYSVTPAEFEMISAGFRVAVPFGKNKIYTGVVTLKHQDRPELYEPKEIRYILDDKPVVTEQQIAHWNWVASYYMCPIGDVFRAAMPSALLLESETTVTFQPESANLNEVLSDNEYLVVQALQQQMTLRIHDLIAILNKKNVFPIIRSLMERGYLRIDEEIAESYKPKLVRYVKVDEKYSEPENLQLLTESLRQAGKQRELLLVYFQLAASKQPVSVKELIAASNSSAAIVKAVVEKGIFETYFLQQDRVLFSDDVAARPKLNPAQQHAFDSIKSSFTEKDVTLLHGITASGKTEIYIRLIEEQLQAGRQSLLLLPEIALTTQLVSRLVKYFGNTVAVYHSKYSVNERVEVWEGVLSDSQKSKVIIGARSALFLPFASLGLIIVDEEHEPMFKQQDPAPRYHARDAAIVLAKLYSAKVLLGSATPAIESYHNVETAKYGFVSLTERYGDAVLPEIEVVDLKDKYFRKRMSGHFSDTLTDSIAECLKNKNQVILFQNRRGWSPVLECMTCGHVPQCRQCDVSLTYHKSDNRLRCHYCGYSMAVPTRCHSCSGTNLSTKGFGTEQIASELSELFPLAKVGRMDHDTTRGKFGYEKIIDSFRNREVDVLVGTQMLGKGLDFDNVALVGIMNADNMLYHPDFRAFERSYQMMSQVAGRSGRSEVRGKVIIQTYNPQHNIIKQVMRGDYEGMYREQLIERQVFLYPPFSKLIRITIKHRDFEKLREAAKWLYQVLSLNLDMPVLGPEEPAVGRIRNEYIRTILIKIPTGKPLEATKKTIRKVLDSFESVAQYRAVKASVNVDIY
ncbi:MAG: primosomal protein N' [Flavobacterium sp.]|nr:MAG: primosomal protein N' [Flavobacterium sp.]